MSAKESVLGGDAESLAFLQSKIESLRNRVKELEAENAKLVSQVSSCQCKLSTASIQKDGMNDQVVSAGKGSVRRTKMVKAGGYKSIPNNLLSKRYVALKVMYFGKRFYGFASEAQIDPTVESELFKALEKTRLLVGDRKESQYSRCGRTDKGVSSTGQVIALFVRSKLKLSCKGNEARVEEDIEEEIDYVRVLNRALPDDIRIMGWCSIPLDFHARFSCLGREYKYFFWRQNLDIMAMETAGRKLVGEHDFRNFCKMDAANVHNYKRCVTFFEISPYHKSYEGDELCAITIKGSAFLWHQVRCMVAVLFMIGQSVESVNVVDALLDTERTPKKPQYKMASETPLVLHSCDFEDLKFTCSSDAGHALCAHLKNEYLNYQLQSAIFHEAFLRCAHIPDDESSRNGRGSKRTATHVTLQSRPTEPSYEERCAKLMSKRRS